MAVALFVRRAVCHSRLLLVALFLRRAVLFSLALSSSVTAQSAKKPIRQDVYDLWKTLSSSSLSPDGQWLAYTQSPVIGNGEVIVRGTKAGAEWRFPRGYTGRPQLTPRADSSAQFNLPAAQFSGDSRWLAFITYAPEADVVAAQRANVGRSGTNRVPLPRNSLTLVSLSDGKATVIPRVRSFRFARDGARFLAYLTDADSTRQELGAPLMLRDLASATDTRIADVASYLFDDAEHWLAYTTSSSDSTRNGAFVRELATGAVTPLAVGKGNYRLLTLDKKGTQVAFVSDRDDGNSSGYSPRYSLYYASLVQAKGSANALAKKVISAGNVGSNVLVADHGRLEFVREGSALQFPLAPVVSDSVPADSLVERSQYDLWHWLDTKIQPQQRVDAARDRNRTWVAVFHPATGKWAQLGSDSLTQVTLADNGSVALALNPVQYSIEQTWGEGGSDAFLVDVNTGARTPIALRLRFGAELSPAARYVAFWHDGRWWAVNTATARRVELSAGIKGVRLENELFDQPNTIPAYGLGGWTKDDKTVLVYDRYDVWEVDPSGIAPPRNLTAGAGRAKGVSLRVVDLDEDKRFIDPAEPIYLRGFSDDTKMSGYFRAKLGVSVAPEQIVYGPKNYGALEKARKAEQYVMTQQTYREFPDLWTGPSVGAMTKVSNANPQEIEYPRGDVELVTWLNDDGVKVQGLLYKPEGFDPSKKYPLITYYYERLSDGMYTYVAPTAKEWTNPYVYTALGYLVFHPDILYTTGQPGASAVKCIIPGVRMLMQRGYVDPKKLGINGQSWGGYQTAYLLTVTNMFAAAVPNAPVVNMTSAYGGIRWGPGVLRQWQYEHAQSRIGGSLWEFPERYIENSPLFKLDRVTTPVLFVANDQDDAVPWYQAIEFYSAMRRLKKEAYLVVYNGEGHVMTKRANQKDVDFKMQQFFGNKLLGQPAPDWMVRGIPYLEKGRDQLKSMRTTDVATPNGRPR